MVQVTQTVQMSTGLPVVTETVIETAAEIVRRTVGDMEVKIEAEDIVESEGRIKMLTAMSI